VLFYSLIIIILHVGLLAKNHRNRNHPTTLHISVIIISNWSCCYRMSHTSSSPCMFWAKNISNNVSRAWIHYSKYFKGRFNH